MINETFSITETIINRERTHTETHCKNGAHQGFHKVKGLVYHVLETSSLLAGTFLLIFLFSKVQNKLLDKIKGIHTRNDGYEDYANALILLFSYCYDSLVFSHYPLQLSLIAYNK